MDVFLKFVFMKESSDFGVLDFIIMFVHKTSTVHMAFFNSLRGAKQLLREANNPRNGAKQILRDSKHLLRETKQILPDSKQLLWEANNPRNGAKQILRDSKQLLRETNKPSNGEIQIQTLGKVTENLLWETIFHYNVINSHNIAFNGIQSEHFVDETCTITRNIRQANHILAKYMIIELLKNKFILKSTNYFETNNASTKIVPRIDYKKVILIMYLINPRYLGVVKTIDILYHVYILYVTNLETENHLEYR